MFPFAFAWLSIHLPDPLVPSISHPLPVQSVHNWATVHTALVDSAAPRGFLTPSIFCFTFPRFSLRTQSKDLGKSTFLSSSALSEEQMRKSLSNLQKQSVTHEIICFQKKNTKNMNLSFRVFATFQKPSAWKHLFGCAKAIHISHLRKVMLRNKALK